MRIVSAQISDLKRATKHGRDRSPETQQLIDAIDTLEPGKAKAVVLQPEDDGARIKARLGYVAKLVNKPLQVAVSDGSVLFALKQTVRRRGRPRKQRIGTPRRR